MPRELPPATEDVEPAQHRRLCTKRTFLLKWIVFSSLSSISAIRSICFHWRTAKTKASTTLDAVLEDVSILDLMFKLSHQLCTSAVVTLRRLSSMSFCNYRKVNKSLCNYVANNFVPHSIEVNVKAPYFLPQWRGISRHSRRHSEGTLHATVLSHKSC